MQHLRFGSGNGFAPADYEDGGWDMNRNNTRGRGPRGRGRGRNFRGRGRGGYNGTYVDTQQDGGYNQEAPVQGRGMCKYFVAYFSCVCTGQFGYLLGIKTQVVVLVFLIYSSLG